MSIFLMLVLISALIIAHEYGHFWVARRCGIKVERFGFGLPFGPTLWSKKIGDVEYCVHAFLMGGYVSFPDDDEDNPLPKDSPERFDNQPLRNRFAVMVAGVTVNAILGWLLMMWVMIGWGVPSMDVTIDKTLNDKTPAAMAGLKSGDVIHAVGGKPIEGYFPMERIEYVKNAVGEYALKPVVVTVLRDKKPMDFKVTPSEKGQIGIQLGGVETYLPLKNPMEATTLSVRYLWQFVGMQFDAFGKIFTGKMDRKELSGPISIVRVGAHLIDKDGIQKGLMLTAIISVILAVMNLLPIPALDGGHVMFLIIEAIKGSKVNKEMQEKITTVGFLGLLCLIIFVLGNDVWNTWIDPIKLPE